jgi:photosystem II stability/assembly factor-like uncharacterized protein
MTVATPPHRPEIEQDRDLEQRVADLEALIEEARRRARRRRQRNGAAALLLAAGGAAAFIGFSGHGGGGAGTAALAHAPGSPGSTAKAESQPLAALPPDAGIAEAFAFDPRSPETVYVTTRGHVFKTTDGGAHWHATATSGSGWMGENEALTADPRHPGTLYAGTTVGVYKTVDGGRSWRPSYLERRPPRDRGKGWVIALAVDPANTKVVYAGSDRVSKSTDGGHSWKTVFPPPTQHPGVNVYALAIASTRPEATYAIKADYANGRTWIYKSTDSGTTWHATTSVPGVNDNGVETALAVDPRHPTTVFAALAGNVLKTTNAGKTWQPITDGLPISGGLLRPGCHCRGSVTTLAVDPRRTGTVYATLTEGGIYKTTNGGQTWNRLANISPAGSSLFIVTVAVNPARPATIYAAGASPTDGLPRILKSTNSGHTWATAPSATTHP